MYIVITFKKHAILWWWAWRCNENFQLKRLQRSFKPSLMNISNTSIRIMYCYSVTHVELMFVEFWNFSKSYKLKIIHLNFMNLKKNWASQQIVRALCSWADQNKNLFIEFFIGSPSSSNSFKNIFTPVSRLILCITNGKLFHYN